MTLLARSSYGLFLIAIAVAAAELTARIDDWLRSDVPLLHTPDHDRDLFMTGPYGERRGRPNGHYKRWKLNEFGFRGPDIAHLPLPGTTRVLILGSSESFGLYESDGNEFPAQLQRELAPDQKYEVINASIPGMTAGACKNSYLHWSSQFGAGIVVIYPNPLFYLNATEQPDARRVARPAVETPLPPEPRILQRLKDVISLPDFVVAYRNAKQVEARRNAQGQSWVFESVPKAQLAMFRQDIDLLVAEVRSAGAHPVLVTHAMHCADLHSARCREIVQSGIVHTPRATPEILLAFESAANQEIRDAAKSHGVRLMDLDAMITGQARCFADLVHFTDEGASQVAKGVAAEIREVSRDSARQ